MVMTSFGAAIFQTGLPSLPRNQELAGGRWGLSQKSLRSNMLISNLCTNVEIQLI